MSPVRLLLTLLATATLVVTLTTASAGAAPGPGRFVLSWGTPKKADRATYDAVKRSGALEAVVDEVNARWSLPADIAVTVGMPSWGPAYESPGDGTVAGHREIHLPSSFFTLIATWMRPEVKGTGLSARRAMVLSMQYILAHEIGHALSEALLLPTTGRDEDAVDGFAAYLLVDNPRFGPASAIASAAFFDILARKRGPLQSSHFADEHSLPQQRTIQLLCWIYGSDRTRYRGLVGNDLLPKQRAVRCRGEWKQLQRAWPTLLAPYPRG